MTTTTDSKVTTKLTTKPTFQEYADNCTWFHVQTNPSIPKYEQMTRFLTTCTTYFASTTISILTTIACTPNEPPTSPPSETQQIPTTTQIAPPNSTTSNTTPPETTPTPEPTQQPTTPCPNEMAKVGKSCVDKWENHLVTIDSNGNATPASPFERPEPQVRYHARSAPNTIPQAYINRIEAQTACENAGKRLCSLNEWYRACRGPRQFMYPYGAQMNKNACNTGKPHVLSIVHGNNPRRWKYDEHFNDPKLNQEPGFLAKTGEYEMCTSGYGTSDMVGNLHEWISDTVDDSLETKIPLRDDIRSKIEKNTGHGIFMGGFFSTTSEHGRGCAFITIGHEPKYHDYSTGFRCCKNANPQ